jgi:hypothetical protein
MNSKEQIVSMFSLENLHQILICTAAGKLLLLQIDLFHNLSVKNNKLDDNFSLNNEFSYVLYDLTIKVNTVTVLSTRYEKNYDLWIGSDNAEIFCFSLKSQRLTGSFLHTSSHHYLTSSVLGGGGGGGRSNSNTASLASDMRSLSLANKDSEKDLNVTIIKTTPADTFFLWSYVHPGSTIYLWNYVSKKIMSAYNCRKAFEELNFKTSINIWI